MDWLASWHTGPDCGDTVHLPPGPHVVGRATTATVRCDDPALAPHHLSIETGEHGVRVVQLAGRDDVRVDRAVDHTVDVHVGSSVLRLRPVAAVTATEAHPPDSDRAHVRPDGTVLRAPRAVPEWRPPELPDDPATAIVGEGVDVADGDSRIGSLLPTALGVAGAAVMAVVMHQPMFLLFGSMGAGVALGSWGLQRRAATRRRRRHVEAQAAAIAARRTAVAAAQRSFRRHLSVAVPTTADARHAAASLARLWWRRAGHGDAHLVSVGRGSVRCCEGAPPDADLPVVADLGPGARVAVLGAHAPAVTRSLIAQLVTGCGPADLRLVLVTDRAERWAALLGLPHLRGAGGAPSIVTARAVAEALTELAVGDARPHVVIVCDDPASLTTRTGPLRRALADRHAFAALLAVVPHGTVPAVCTAVLRTSDGPVAGWVADTQRGASDVEVRITGLGDEATATITTALARLHDPEDLLDAGRLPADVALDELLATHHPGPLTATLVRRRWEALGDQAPCTPIGMAADGVVDVDLERDGPHGLLAGTTGSGKSELLRSLVAGLAASTHPQHLQLVLVDYKGGATFADLTRLPHVAAVVTDLDDDLADRALRSLHAELRRRERVLRDAGAADLRALLDAGGRLPRLLVVIDEFAALVAEQPEFLHALLGVAQRGRSLGVHLLLATQRPHGIVSDDIRANTDLRIALRLHDTADAMDVVGDPRPAALPRQTPGRAVMRLGADEHVVFQTARLTDPAPVVDAVVAAATGHVPAPPPWLPPLPAVLARRDVPEGALGWCDDPDRQRRVPLHWDAADGGVLVAGAPGSGVTTTLQTLTAHAAASGHAVHVVHDPRDRGWAPLALHPGVVAVPFDDHERVARLVHRLTDAGDWCPAGRSSVVVIDDVDLVRRTLDDRDSATAYEQLEAVLSGARHTMVLGTAHPAAVPSAAVARCTHRWALHLADRHDASVVGVPGPAAMVPGRLVVAGSGLTAQVIAPSDDLPAHRGERWLPPIAVVPASVPAGSLPPAWRGDDEDRWPIGIELAGATAATLGVPDGEHVFVVGGPRSGRSTALDRMVAAWRSVHPQGWIVAVLPRRSTVDRHRADVIGRDVTAVPTPTCDLPRPLLVVCDDAESVDDDGRLAALVAARRPGVTVIAAVHGDAVRQRYGHWTAGVRLSHLGLVSASSADRDGDLLGVALPHRAATRPRPGLMWLVTHEGQRLVQVAVDGPVRAGQRNTAAAQAANAAVAASATASSDRPR